MGKHAILLALMLASLAAPAHAMDTREVLDKFGFFGTWSPHCEEPASPTNSRRHAYVGEGDAVRFVENFGDKAKENVYAVLTATRQADDRVQLSIELNGANSQRLTMIKQNGRIRTLSNRNIAGHYLVRDGVIMANGKPTPWMNRCGDKP